MPVKRVTGSMNVVDAARQRVRNAFQNGVKVYLSFSAGKDSLCMAHITYDLILRGEVDPKQLTVIFIDEEALYQSMEDMTLRWRKRFRKVGVEFRWYCLPFKQVSILRQLQNEESWITWEPGKEDAWVRTPPPFAIRSDTLLRFPGEMNYQTFCGRKFKDGIQLIGVRASESVQRLTYISKANMGDGLTGGAYKIFPIYDWTDKDVWLYIKEYNLDFPESYMDLYAVGTPKSRLRMCNYFAAESIAGLRQIAELDPELWARIEKREPNAYLTLLYWDSEMFKRSTRKRAELEEGLSRKNYKALLKNALFENFEKNFTTPERRKVAIGYRQLYVKMDAFLTPALYKRMYESLMAGDPKCRSLRALWTAAAGNAAKTARRDEAARKGVNANAEG